ncbi:MAG TPA: response regulator [Nitrospira sp.]|nr:response regulator [Nitrospira sp.]
MSKATASTHPHEQSRTGVSHEGQPRDAPREEALGKNQEKLLNVNTELVQRVGDLTKMNAEVQDSRRAALNLMEDAVRSRQTIEMLNQELRESEEALRGVNDTLEQRVIERTQELAQSEDRLRALATELNLAEQRERKRLATDLHDYLAQLLVVGVMTLSQAKRIGLPPRAEDFVKQTEETLGKALTYCRTLMAELSPPVLQEQGLLAGLMWLVDYMQRHELAVTVDVERAGDIVLPEDRAVLLFQSVRELLINVAKHGTVKRATVRMIHEEGLLRIVVRDENGFDLAAAAAAAAADNTSPLSSKFGLFSIRERMKSLGGSFDLQSAPGQGTTATLTLRSSVECSVLSAELSGSNSALPGRSALITQSSALQKNATVRVLLVDDHTLMRQGLRSIVSGYAHLEVVGEAGDGVEAVALVERLDPDVVVMDIDMPKMGGIEATRRIKTHHPSTVVIGLSVNQLFDAEEKMKAVGAAAYLTKETAADALCQAIDEAISHERETDAYAARS